MYKKSGSFIINFSIICFALLHLPSAFAKNTHNDYFNDYAHSLNVTENPVKISVYDSLQLDMAGLSVAAFDYAKQGFENLIESNKLKNDSILTIIDFSKPSNTKRLFILDMKNYKVLFNTLVAHGKNTGREWATSFSNEHSSFKSSPGFYITRETYMGKNGYSLKLQGMERGINDNAYDRGIVVHAADYVNPGMAKARGWIGRSYGCPALPTPVAKTIINNIKFGTCLFIYHPSYIKKSALLG